MGRISTRKGAQMKIAIANTKGGVGKTTSAIHLGQALVDHYGKQVLVLDADPQGTATSWAERAEEDGTPLGFEVQASNNHLLRRLSQMDDDRYVLVDCPPGNPETISAAVSAADVVIVPTAPSSHDMERLWITLDSIGTQVPAVVLLTAARSGTTLLRETVEVLDEYGINRFDNVVHMREAIRKSLGQRPTDYAGYVEVAGEILELEQILAGTTGNDEEH